MQDTRANMGAHLKWDIPMFLGIASTKDGRLGLTNDQRTNVCRIMLAVSSTTLSRALTSSLSDDRHICEDPNYPEFPKVRSYDVRAKRYAITAFENKPYVIAIFFKIGGFCERRDTSALVRD